MGWNKFMASVALQSQELWRNIGHQEAISHVPHWRNVELVVLYMVIDGDFSDACILSKIANTIGAEIILSNPYYG
jgi:hypothetical protein